jgi:hypothetical protein
MRELARLVDLPAGSERRLAELGALVDPEMAHPVAALLRRAQRQLAAMQTQATVEAR